MKAGRQHVIRHTPSQAADRATPLPAQGADLADRRGSRCGFDGWSRSSGAGGEATAVLRLSTAGLPALGALLLQLLTERAAPEEAVGVARAALGPLQQVRGAPPGVSSSRGSGAR